MIMELIVDSINKNYGDKSILSQISLAVPTGKIISLLGPSGVGKTTLFNLIAGLELPDSGSIQLNNTEITGKTGKVSYMLQKDLLLPYKTIEDNIALPLILKGVKKKTALKKVATLLPEFGLLGVEKVYPNALSGGMRQRAALLRTYLFSGELILLDEPFSALDAITKRDLHQWFLKIQKELSLTTLLITHDIDEAIFLSDQIYLLAGSPGKITATITVSRPENKEEDFSLTPAFLDYKRSILQKMQIN